MNNEEAIKILKNETDYLCEEKEEAIGIILNLIEKQQKEIEDKKEEIYAIARANYILGQTDERSQWYKKINEEIKKLETIREWLTDSNGINELSASIDTLKELIGKEE